MSEKAHLRMVYPDQKIAELVAENKKLRSQDEFLPPLLTKMRNNLDYWLASYGYGNDLLVREVRHDFAILNAAIARRIPVQGES